MRDVWAVYEGSFAEIRAEAEDAASQDPEVGSVLGPILQRQAGGDEGGGYLSLVRSALAEDDWEPLFAYYQVQGRRFADRGIGIGAWFKLLAGLRSRLRPRVRAAYMDERERLAAAVSAVETFVDAALIAVTTAYIDCREETITRQQEAIRELSTPVLPLRDGMLLVPVVGLVDSQRAHHLTEQLLTGIRSHRAKVVVLDLTGVPIVDSAVANHLLQTVQAARLLGAHGIITGISSANAQTLVRLGTNLGSVQVAGDLREGVEEANRVLDA
jgi:rsbT co-antagonist protein RsbR